MENEAKRPDQVKEFVEKYWPVLVAGGTVVGATIWLVARFIKERKDKNSEVFGKLSQLEHEALSVNDETSILMETGSHLAKVAGNEISFAADELSGHLTNDKAKSTIQVLKNLSAMEKKKPK